ncbi:lysophospholipid acyltransferase family protein [Zhengella sp. ZM62]|uniref:lysophospholipid acyltransferase family protein n=1 Tax=Zhengella sedimenti TaxID=3390035 RepID=UPI0039749883
MASGAGGRAVRVPAIKRLWIALRGRLVRSPSAKRLLARLVYGGLMLVERTNRPVAGSVELSGAAMRHGSVIATTWHGRHFMFACLNRQRMPATVMVSRSADAELNAMVLRFGGIRTVRGSGGRPGVQQAGKGGASALIQLKRRLDKGEWVGMVANVIKGAPREAGMGIITLARLSGRPILPLAYQTTRRKVLEKSWDLSVINLPFGRAAAIAGDPIHVAADATDEDMEAARQRLTDELNRIHARADALLDGRP